MKQMSSDGATTGGVFSRIGRAMGSSLGYGRNAATSGENEHQRSVSTRRLVDRVEIPLTANGFANSGFANNGFNGWSSRRYGEYYAQSTAVHAAVRVLAEAVSRPQLEVWRRTTPDGELVLAGIDHPLQRLLDQPSEHWTGGLLLRTVESRLALWGSAFVVLVRDVDGVPYEMWPLRSDEVHVVAEDSGRIVRGFIHETAEGRVAYLPEEMLWYRRFNPLQAMAGFSSMAPARAAVDMSAEALRFNRRFYVNSAMPTDVVITTNAQPRKEQIERIIDVWETRFENPDAAHRPLILSQGLEMKRLGINQTEMQFIAALEWSVEEVSRAFGVPKVFLSEFEDATLANVRTMEQFLWRNTIIPELRMLEEGMNQRLAPHFSRFPNEVCVRFNLSKVEAVQESQLRRTTVERQTPRPTWRP